MLDVGGDGLQFSEKQGDELGVPASEEKKYIHQVNRAWKKSFLSSSK